MIGVECEASGGASAGIKTRGVVEAPQPERLARLAQVLVPQEVVLERVEKLVEQAVPVRVSLWTRSWVGGSLLTIMVGETNLKSCSTVVEILTREYISIIPCSSSLRFYSVRFGARGVVDPDLLPPFGRVGNIGLFCWKNGRRTGEKSGIKCGQTREGSPGLCTSTYDVQMNVLSVGKWKEN